ncbi:peptidoglycan-associated lipoprotein Pal [Marinimicrobium sp. ABcell2]|uniref:peptidoglycan-associated lipoprotein Pal n=1 Tax=Marinimicrobium sp. ABcell2 TaxID=3069751 RepID=UPI0027B041DA|nr:peptidoglycan-associated lipoprotein Pal [Marinimicrobium sp. ABcell2]MDQ2077897.1 peptidoglycan-associated lipoprotein Pal [Marinimicrobium sp. ABcell2]
MISNVFKQGFFLAFVLAFLAGCTATDTMDDADDAAADRADERGVTTGTADRDRLRASEEDDAEALDNVIYFGFDQATLQPESRALLLAHAERLRNPGNNVSVRLEGHTDERGSREYNMALGERRANAVRDFLVLQGVSRDILEVISYGEERPAARGSNDSAWAQNRRVEIKY